MKISGETKLCGIIGQPVRHSLSPVFQNAAFKHAGLNWVYLPFEVEPSGLGDAIAGLKAAGCRGLNVTMPYKHAVIELLDGLSESASMVDAVNTIEFKSGRLIGHNTDGRGFVASLREDAEFDPRGKSAIIIGAGGAARAVALALAQSGLSKLLILNRRPVKAEELMRLIFSRYPDCTVGVSQSPDSDISEYDLIVNTTPVGMEQSPGLPNALEGIEVRQIVYDIIYWPLETEFLKLAKEKGARTMNGARMLLHQGAASFTVWTGRPAPLVEMTAALADELSSQGWSR